MSAVVVLIAGYHYTRIFNGWGESFRLEAGVYKPTGVPFNDAYRYVDWLLTVPLLCAELVAVLRLKPATRGPLMAKLVIAAVLMIALGYPGEVATSMMARGVWGALATIHFVYILYLLWGELAKAAATESPRVKLLLSQTRLLLLATWGFYPIAYLLPQLGIGGQNALIGVQVGYTIADVAAKCGYGIMIYAIARAKMAAAGEISEAIDSKREAVL